MRIFIGSEQEGVHRGVLTMFIEGAVPAARIREELTKTPDVKQIYFGAGYLSEFDLESIKDLISLNKLITVETVVKLPIELKDSVSVMLPLFMSGERTLISSEVVDFYLDWENVQVKLDTGKIVLCCSIQEFLRNDFSGYREDVDVWTATGAANER